MGPEPSASERSRGWRVGHQGRDRMYYEELRNGRWERLDIDGEMLMGRAHHVIYFASGAQWLRYPAWARDRRAEIIARVTSEFREPDYEYHGLEPDPPPGSAAPSASPPPEPLRAPRRPPGGAPQGMRALLVAVLLLFTLAGAMGWLVVRGASRGEATLPMPRATQRRPVSRAQEPATYWLSMGIYAAIGAGSLALGVLGARAAPRSR